MSSPLAVSPPTTTLSFDLVTSQSAPVTKLATNVTEISARSHTGGKPFPCGNCGDKFEKETTMINHMKCLHTNRIKQPGPERADVYPLSDTDLKDVIIGNDENGRSQPEPELRISCGNCDPKTDINEAVKSHARIHTRGQPFPCGNCGKMFENKTAMIDHIKCIHTKNRIEQPGPEQSTSLQEHSNGDQYTFLKFSPVAQTGDGLIKLKQTGWQIIPSKSTEPQ
jgi:hypothetical protein